MANGISTCKCVTLNYGYFIRYGELTITRQDV